jgi:hypothetical protein
VCTGPPGPMATSGQVRLQWLADMARVHGAPVQSDASLVGKVSVRIFVIAGL